MKILHKHGIRPVSIIVVMIFIFLFNACDKDTKICLEGMVPPDKQYDACLRSCNNGNDEACKYVASWQHDVCFRDVTEVAEPWCKSSCERYYFDDKDTETCVKQCFEDHIIESCILACKYGDAEACERKTELEKIAKEYAKKVAAEKKAAAEAKTRAEKAAGE